MRRRDFLFAGFCGMVWSSIGYGHPFSLSPIAVRRIALNFDDGPEPEILKNLLPLLEKLNAKATFFVIGELAKAHGDLLRREHQLGHEIENHGYQHIFFTKLLREHGLGAVSASLGKTADLIVQASGRYPRFFRPPFWDVNPELEKHVVESGYTVMRIGKPDINTEDYDDVKKKRPPSALITRVQEIVDRRDRAGIFTHVLVMHERKLTVDALATHIPQLQDQGYHFVRLDEVAR